MPVPKQNLNLDEEYIQMSLGLELPEVELDGVSVEEAKRRAAAGHAALMLLKGTADQPGWFAHFELLTSKGLPWRQACYVAWASMPKEGRNPKTQDELATKHLNLTSDRAISKWRKDNKQLDILVAFMQTAPLWEYRADFISNLIKGMMKAGEDYKFFNHLKMYGEMTGDYVPLQQLAAVLKRKTENGVHDVEDSTLDELAEGAEELEAMTRSTNITLDMSETPDEESDDDAE